MVSDYLSKIFFGITGQACERRQVSSEEHLHVARLTGEEGVIQKTTSVCDAT